jgi:hypothetical protein
MTTHRAVLRQTARGLRDLLGCHLATGWARVIPACGWRNRMRAREALRTLPSDRSIGPIMHRFCRLGQPPTPCAGTPRPGRVLARAALFDRADPWAMGPGPADQSRRSCRVVREHQPRDQDRLRRPRAAWARLSCQTHGCASSTPTTAPAKCSHAIGAWAARHSAPPAQAQRAQTAGRLASCSRQRLGRRACCSPASHAFARSTRRRTGRSTLATPPRSGDANGSPEPARRGSA